MTPPGDYAHFRPWPWLVVFARLIAEAFDDGLRRPSIVKLAEQCRVNRVTVFKALARADVRAWLGARLGTDDDWKTRQIMSRIAGQALAGSKDHQRIWLELQGRLGAKFGDAAPKLGDGWTVNIGVPMAPPLPAGSLEPMPIDGALLAAPAPAQP